jgi:hypothetical protein
MVTWEAWRQQQALLQSDPEALKSWEALMERQKAAEETAKQAASEPNT